MAVVSILEFASGKIGYSVSFDEREKINLPSMTICPYSQSSKGFYDKTNLKDLASIIDEIPLNLTLILNAEGQDEDARITINMTNSDELKTHFNASLKEIWHAHCQLVGRRGTSCNPCFTFNSPKKTVGQFIVSLKS